MTDTPAPLSTHLGNFTPGNHVGGNTTQHFRDYMVSAFPWYYNVQHYGAVLDGVTVDTAAVNAAMTAASAGGTVFFPAGVCLVDDALAFPAGKTMRWQGVGEGLSIIRRKSGGSAQVLTISGTHLSSENFSSLADLTLDGNGGTGKVTSWGNRALFHANNVEIMNGTAGAGTGLELLSMWDSNFDNVYVHDCGSSTEPCVILDTESSGDNTLNTCHFYNLHIEPGDQDAIYLDLIGNATNAVDAPTFTGLKLHGNPTSGNPNRTLLRIGQYAPGVRIIAPTFAFGKSTSQIEIRADRCYISGPIHGINDSHAPTYAYQVYGSGNVIMAANFKTPGYGSAFFRGESTSIHNKFLYPIASGADNSFYLSDSGRNFIAFDDLNSSGGFVNTNVDGFV